MGTRGCIPVVSVARWCDPALPKTTWQLVSVERYWEAVQQVASNPPRNDRYADVYTMKEVAEAMDWKAIQALLK
jgi:hypothetical protein